MFESIIIRPNSSRNLPINLGQMIENMFFYQNTIVHIGRNEIGALFKLADVDVLVELLKSPGLKIYYNNSHTGIADINGVRFVDSFSLSGLDIEKELYEVAAGFSKDEITSKKFSKKLARLIDVHSLPSKFNKILNEQLLDNDYLEKVVRKTLKYYHPHEEFDQCRYELEFIDDNQFIVHSNLDQIGVNPKLVSVDSPLLAIVNSCEDLQVAGEAASEILLPEFNSQILQLKINSTLEATMKSQKEIDVFTHFLYDSSWALSDAINQKKIHVKAVLPVLRKANQFKHWLQQLHPDENLIEEFIARTEEKTVFERLPSKAIRFYLFNGIGTILSFADPIVGIPVTTGLNILDTFILDKIGKKWEPSQFINKDLRPLVNGS